MDKRFVCALLAVVMLLGLAGAGIAETAEDRPVLTISCSDFTPGANWMDPANAQYNWRSRLMEETGVTLKYVGSRYASLTTEQLLLLIADNSLPDLIWGPNLFSSTSTEPAIMIEDGYILKLNDYLDQLPNFARYIEENPEYAASMMLDDGTLFGFPTITTPTVSRGLLVRGDWLEELGMDVPRTPAQLKEFLIAARDQFGAKTPFAFQSEYLEYNLPRCWDNGGTTWYVEDGKVKFGALEPGFKEFIIEISEWYAEGLIDPDMPSASKQSVEAAMSNGSAAAVFNQLPKVENMYDFNKDNPNYCVLGTNLCLDDSELPKFGGMESGVSWNDAIYINAQCENIDAALRFCDFMFSPEGILLNNYGTQGFSFDYDEDGNIVEAGVLLDDSIGQTNVNKMYAVAKRGGWPGPVEGNLFGYIAPAVAVGEAWLNTRAFDMQIPNLVLTVEENDRYAAAWSDSYTLYRESIMQFVMGTKPIEEFDAFMDQMRAFGIEECVAIKQAAYDRYLAIYNNLVGE